MTKFLGFMREDLQDVISIWLTRLLIFSLPLMVFNPMNPAYYSLQLTEILAVLLFPMTVWRLVSKRQSQPPISFLQKSLAIFILVLFLSSFRAGFTSESVLACVKVSYLAALAIIIYLNGVYFKCADNLRGWMAASFIIVLAGGVFGGILLLLGVHNFLAEPSRIIGVALGISDWLPVTPRVTSFLKPTANMAAAYLAVLALPCLSHVFEKHIDSSRAWLRLGLLGLVVCLSFLTMSRGFIGVLLAIWLGLTLLHWEVPGRRLCSCLFGFAAITGFIILQIFTVFYPLEKKFEYTNDPAFTKEVVDLGTKQVPNPVYFLRSEVGAEKVTLQISYAYNHYAWLKYAGIRLFKQNPVSGIGFGFFSGGVSGLVEDGVLPKNLASYRGAQSQYFTLLGEVGIIGCLSVGVLIIALLRSLKMQFGKDKDNFVRATLMCLPVVALIAIDMDILSFRWLWGLFGLSLISVLPTDKSLEEGKGASNRGC